MLYLITGVIAFILSGLLVQAFFANEIFGAAVFLSYTPFLLLLIPYFIQRRKRKSQFTPVKRN